MGFVAEKIFAGQAGWACGNLSLFFSRRAKLGLRDFGYRLWDFGRQFSAERFLQNFRRPRRGCQPRADDGGLPAVRGVLAFLAAALKCPALAWPIADRFLPPFVVVCRTGVFRPAGGAAGFAAEVRAGVFLGRVFEPAVLAPLAGHFAELDVPEKYPACFFGKSSRPREPAGKSEPRLTVLFYAAGTEVG